MDNNEPELELDWEVIEQQIAEYDSGNINPHTLQAKMLEMAYNEGYDNCMEDQERAKENLMIMLTQPSGNA